MVSAPLALAEPFNTGVKHALAHAAANAARAGWIMDYDSAAKAIGGKYRHSTGANFLWLDRVAGTNSDHTVYCT